MRPRLSSLAIRQGESHAARTHRSVSDALSILIDAGYRSLTGAQTQPTAVSIDSTDDEGLSGNRTVGVRMPVRMAITLQEMADKEHRSVAFVVKALVREGLDRRGLWRGGDRPKLSAAPTAAPATEPAA